MEWDGKLAMRVAINLGVLLIIMAAWFILQSRDLYTGQMVPLYYPAGVLIIGTFLFALNGWLLKTSFPATMALIAIGLVIFVGVSKPLEANTLYRDVMRHYYYRYHAYTLQRFPEYMNADWNYVSVAKALKDSDIRVKRIEAGYGEGIGDSEVEAVRTRTQGIYLINGDTYALFDWQERRLLKTYPLSSVREAIRAQLGAGTVADAEQATAYRMRFTLASGDSRSFYIYAGDGELKWLID